MKLLLFLAVFIFYTYAGYPVMLYIWSLFFSRSVKKVESKAVPLVSVVICARNEESRIAKRINNILWQDYPKDRLEIIVVSDGSTDKTLEVLQHLPVSSPDAGILRVFSCERQSGKPSALNLGVENARGGILVFTDCRQHFAPDAIRQLVNNFNDPKVGAASGALVFENTPGSLIQNEMNIYWNFEKWVRSLESRTGSVPNVTGAIYAMRKELFIPLPAGLLLDDVLVPLNVAMQGYRVILDETAVAFDTVSKNAEQEKTRKIRTLAGNWQLLLLKPALLNPFANPVWFKFLSHKIFRLLVPYAFIILLGVILYLNNIFSFFLLALIMVSMFMGLSPSMRSNIISRKVSSAIHSVLMLNYCAFMAPIRLITSGEKLW